MTSAGMSIKPLQIGSKLISDLRHLSIVRNAFAGIPTLVKEVITAEELREAAISSDIL